MEDWTEQLGRRSRDSQEQEDYEQLTFCGRDAVCYLKTIVFMERRAKSHRNEGLGPQRPEGIHNEPLRSSAQTSTY